MLVLASIDEQTGGSVQRTICSRRMTAADVLKLNAAERIEFKPVLLVRHKMSTLAGTIIGCRLRCPRTSKISHIAITDRPPPATDSTDDPALPVTAARVSNNLSQTLSVKISLSPSRTRIFPFFLPRAAMLARY